MYSSIRCWTQDSYWNDIRGIPRYFISIFQVLKMKRVVSFMFSISFSRVQLNTMDSNVFQRNASLLQIPDTAEPPLSAFTTTMESVNSSSMEAAVATKTIMKLRIHAWQPAQVVLCVTVDFPCHKNQEILTLCLHPSEGHFQRTGGPCRSLYSKKCQQLWR